MGRQCPNCKGKKLRKAMTAGVAKKVTSGGLPQQVAGKSGNAKGAGIGGSSFTPTSNAPPKPTPKSQDAEKDASSKDSMQYKPKEESQGKSPEDRDKFVFQYGENATSAQGDRVSMAMQDSLSQNIHLSNVVVSDKTINRSEAGIGYCLESDHGSTGSHEGPTLSDPSKKNIRVDVDDYGTERIYSIDSLGNETLISEKKSEQADSKEEEDMLEGALMDADRLVQDHTKGGNTIYSTLSDAYFRISSLESFEAYIKSLESFKTQGVSIVSVDATNAALMDEVAKQSIALKNTYFSIVISPTSIRQNSKFDLAEIIEKPLVDNKKVIAVGEIGLDLHFAPYTQDKQEQLFVAQAALAHKYDKPVYLTAKMADDALVKTVQTIMSETPVQAAMVPIIRTPQLMQMVLTYGFYVLMRPEASYPHEDIYRELLREIPKEKVLLASASEHIAPFTKTGSWNSPEFLPEMIKFGCSFYKMVEHEKAKLEDKFTQNLLTFLKRTS